MNGSKNVTNIMIIIAICSVGGIIFGGSLLLPKFEEYQATKKALDSKRNELTYKEDYFKKLQEVESKIKEYDSELAKIDVALPNEPSLPSLFDYLQKTCSQSGLVINEMGSFTVANSAKHPGLKEISLTLEVSGPYESIKSLLTVLEKSSRLINIESVAFGTVSEGKTGLSQISDVFPYNLAIKVYSY